MRAKDWEELIEAVEAASFTMYMLNGFRRRVIEVDDFVQELKKKEESARLSEALEGVE